MGFKRAQRARRPRPYDAISQICVSLDILDLSDHPIFATIRSQFLLIIYTMFMKLFEINYVKI